MTNTAAALNQNGTSILKTTSLSQGAGLKTPEQINCLITLFVQWLGEGYVKD